MICLGYSKGQTLRCFTNLFMKKKALLKNQNLRKQLSHHENFSNIFLNTNSILNNLKTPNTVIADSNFLIRIRQVLMFVYQSIIPR